MLELYYNFFKKFCDTDKYEELEMDTNSLYLGLSDENLDVFLPEKRAEGDQLRSKDCTDDFTANATDTFSPELAAMSTRNMIRESQVSSKKSLGVQKCCVSSETYCCYDKHTHKHKFSSKGLNKEHWKSVATVDQC